MYNKKKWEKVVLKVNSIANKYNPSPVLEKGRGEGKKKEEKCMYEKSIFQTEQFDVLSVFVFLSMFSSSFYFSNTTVRIIDE